MTNFNETIDFLNLERYPETVEAYADQHNPLSWLTLPSV